MKLIDWMFGKKRTLSKKQMDLLWYDPARLQILKNFLGNPNVIIESSDESVTRDLKDVTAQDIEWAEKLGIIGEKATAAGQRGDYQTAIQLLKAALKQAPDSDFFLMCIGCAYASMGKPRAGLPYLEKAARISPANDRIQNNLSQVRQFARNAK